MIKYYVILYYIISYYIIQYYIILHHIMDIKSYIYTQMCTSLNWATPNPWFPIQNDTFRKPHRHRYKYHIILYIHIYIYIITCIIIYNYVYIYMKMDSISIIPIKIGQISISIWFHMYIYICVYNIYIYIYVYIYIIYIYVHCLVTIDYPQYIPVEIACWSVGCPSLPSPGVSWRSHNASRHGGKHSQKFSCGRHGLVLWLGTPKIHVGGHKGEPNFDL